VTVEAEARSELIAATLDYRFDYPRIADEVRSCEEFFVYTPPYRRQIDQGISGGIPFMSESAANYRRIDSMAEDGITTSALKGVSTFYLRNSKECDVTEDSRFRTTKALSHRSWFWRPELRDRLRYTIQCIESLPYRTLGLIRAFLCEDSFMPTHRDTQPDANGAYDRSRALGVSLIPATGDRGMLIWNERRRRTHEVRGHCLLFDDSCWHGVPMTRGLRITLRILGELDLAKVGRHVRHEYRC
jgi:hypothetical protein